MNAEQLGVGAIITTARDVGPVSGVERAQEKPDARTVAEAMEALRSTVDTHPIWRGRLLSACSAGHLTREDLRLVFSQYHLYSKSFTRFLAALMTSSESDLDRALLSANLWEEGGGAEPENRHAEIFRDFLRRGLDVDVDAIEYLDATRLFVREYLDFCRFSSPMSASAFLAMGTEAIVPRLYTAFLDGLRRAGVAEEHTRFFQIHIACDDAHAATLADIMARYAGAPGWLDACRSATLCALDLRARFFDQLFEAVEARRIRAILDGVQRREPPLSIGDAHHELHHRLGVGGVTLYENRNASLEIDFVVERVPFATDVLDARVLRVAPHRYNERHRHPHESLFYVIHGRGRVQVDEATIDVAPGDLVYVPRWATHQSRSTSGEGLLVLAMTDFGLTERAFIGNHLKTTRMKGEQAERR